MTAGGWIWTAAYLTCVGILAVLALGGDTLAAVSLLIVVTASFWLRVIGRSL